jgi:CPA1 family monovalent cation:H+ antiporter
MTVSFVVILIVACAMALLARRLKLPYTVVLVVAGLAVSALNGSGDANLLGIEIRLSPELLLQLFLPILLFEAAFHVDLDEFLENKRAILFLAIPGVIVGMLLVTALFVPAAQAIGVDLNWQGGLLIAAMLAATDPISVVALFKEFTVSKRLGIIIEGESLINDGIAVVLFGVVVKITADSLGLTLPHIDTAGGVQALHVFGEFLREVLLGTVIGLAVGLGISYITSKVDDHLIEVALTAIAAYGSNSAAISLHASGVIAVVVCGMMIGNVGAKRGMSPTTREAVFSFWEFAAFLANSFVFILIGLEIDLRGFWGDAGLILLFFATMILVRAMVVIGVSTFVRREDLRLRRSWLPVITWAGVRGSLSMVLAMMLVATTDIGGAHRETILNIVYGVVLLSILAQGTTMAWLMKRAGLIIETPEEIEYEMALARRQAIRRLLDEIDEAEKKGTLSRVTYDQLHDQLLARRQANDRRIADMLEHTSTLNELEMKMHSNHLRALEKQIYRDLEKEGDLDYESMESLVKDVSGQKPKKGGDNLPE